MANTFQHRSNELLPQQSVLQSIYWLQAVKLLIVFFFLSQNGVAKSESIKNLSIKHCHCLSPPFPPFLDNKKRFVMRFLPLTWPDLRRICKIEYEVQVPSQIAKPSD